MNITSGKLVHILNGTKWGAYPLCNPGLLIGSIRSDGVVYFHGKWSYTNLPVGCSKCQRMDK